MEEKIRDIFEKLGYCFDEQGQMIDDGIDSIEFIHIILALEEAFQIQIPDNYLVIESIESIECVINMIGYAEEISYADIK